MTVRVAATQVANCSTAVMPRQQIISKLRENCMLVLY